MAGIAWVNGKLAASEEPAISPLDPGFLYGEGLFETMRAYRGRVFRLSQHLDRLLNAAPQIGLTPPARQVLEGAIAEALGASGLEDGSVRLTVTPGPTERGEPTVVVLVRPLALPPAEWYATGCSAVSVTAAHAMADPLRSIKSLNYLDKLMAQRAAAQAGAEEAIIVDPDGFVVEGAMRNVFAVLGDAVVTPPLSRGLLPGITRAAVLEVLGERPEAKCSARDISLAELHGADECFLTSSLAEILPVASVDGHLMAAAPGPITRMAVECYRRLVAAELDLGGELKRPG